MSRTTRLLLALLASLGFVFTMATPASAATTGGDIGLSSGSAGFVYIWESAGFSKVLWPGDSSYMYSGFYNDVQKFRPASGYKCRSQYSGTAYPYVGPNVYYMSQNNLNLELYCKTG